MKKSEIIGYLAPEALLADGLYDAIIGLADVFTERGSRSVVAYDKQKIIEILIKRDRMEDDEAEEFYQFNIAGSYVGEGTPVFIDYRWALGLERPQQYDC